jgi:hypothetical protein
MVSPSVDVLIPVVVKSGAAVALAICMDSGNGATTTVAVRRAATRARGERKLKVFNT